MISVLCWIKAHKSALLVQPGRATLLTALEKVTFRKAAGFADRIIRRLVRILSAFIKTQTFDNVKAFARQCIKTVEQYLNFRPVRKIDFLSPIQQTLKHRCVALIN